MKDRRSINGTPSVLVQRLIILLTLCGICFVFGFLAGALAVIG